MKNSRAKSLTIYRKILNHVLFVGGKSGDRAIRKLGGLGAYND